MKTTGGGVGSFGLGRGGWTFRRKAAVACMAAGATLASAPFLTRGDAATAPAHTGASSVSLSLPSLSITDPVTGKRSAGLGSLTAAAQSYPSLVSSLTLGGLAAMGQSVPAQSYTSANGPRSGSLTLPLPAGPVTGSVSLVDYLVQAAGGTATAQLSGLSGQIGAAPLGLGASLGQHGILTQVTPTGSVGGLQAASPGLSLKLSDLLPAGVLNGLPLGTVIALLQSTGAPLSSTLSSALTQVQSTLASLQTLSSDLTSLSSAQATVTSLTGSSPAIAAAQAQVAAAQQAVVAQQATLTAAQSTLSTDTAAQSSAQSAVTTDQAAVSQAQSTLTAAQAAEAAACPALLSPLSVVSAACTAAQALVSTDQAALSAAGATLSGAQSALSAANAALTSATAAVSSAQSTLTGDQSQLSSLQATLASLIAAASAPGSPLATAQGLVTTLTTTINTLLGQIQTLLGSLPNLSTLLQQLTSALGNAPLLNVGNLSLGLNSSADNASGASSVTCTLGSVTVLGVPVAAPTCADLNGLVSGIGTKLAGALAVLPSAARPSVVLDGLKATSSATAAPAADGATSAVAGLTALHLAVAPISLSGLADSLTAQLQAQLQAVLSGLGVSAPAVARAHLSLPTGVGSLLGTLSTQVSVLPTGGALAGLSTLGLDATLLGATSSSTYQTGSASPTTPAASPTTPAASPTTPAASPTTPAGTPGGSATPGGSTQPSSTPPAGGAQPAPTGPTHSTPAGKLPFTGINAAGMMAAGLLLFVLGAQLLVICRRLEQGPGLLPARVTHR